MVYKDRGRERVGKAGWGGVETDRQTEIEDEEGGEDRQKDGRRETERESCIQKLLFINCFAGDCS